MEPLEELQDEFDKEKLKLLQERLIIETTNLELQKDMLSNEKSKYDTESQSQVE